MHCSFLTEFGVYLSIKGACFFSMILLEEEKKKTSSPKLFCYFKGWQFNSLQRDVGSSCTSRSSRIRPSVIWWGQRGREQHIIPAASMGQARLLMPWTVLSSRRHMSHGWGHHFTFKAKINKQKLGNLREGSPKLGRFHSDQRLGKVWKQAPVP